jgi:hypothetical protein
MEYGHYHFVVAVGFGDILGGNQFVIRGFNSVTANDTIVQISSRQMGPALAVAKAVVKRRPHAVFETGLSTGANDDSVSPFSAEPFC